MTMKSRIFFAACLAVMLSGLFSCHEKNNVKSYREQSFERRKAIDALFSDPKTSPLNEEDIKTFTGLSYYEPDESYIVPAKIEKLPQGELIEMPHTMNRKYPFIRFGTVHFRLGTDSFRLTLYMSQEEAEKKEEAPTLFIPFKDQTNDSETYEGGRYLDIAAVHGESITLDFNRAYNPNCAYSHNYSCPLVPAENTLNIPIRAGAKRYHTPPH
jgi:uncharacterized protein (DUF1684 family)